MDSTLVVRCSGIHILSLDVARIEKSKTVTCYHLEAKLEKELIIDVDRYLTFNIFISSYKSKRYEGRSKSNKTRITAPFRKSADKR